jgi:hypothetical protein
LIFTQQKADFSCWLEPDSVWQDQESGGIRRNPEESGVNTGIPVPQGFLQKIPVTAAKNRNSCDQLQNHVPVKKSSRKTQGKKEILRNPGRNGFFGPKHKFLKTGICNLGNKVMSQ